MTAASGQSDFQQGVATAVTAGMTMAADAEIEGLSASRFMLRLREGLEELAYRHAGDMWRPVLLESADSLYDDYGCPNGRWRPSDVIKWLERGWDADRAIQLAVGNAISDGDRAEAARVLSGSTRLSLREAVNAVRMWAAAGFPGC